MTTWEDSYLQKAESLQEEVWTKKDTEDLRALLFNTTMHKAIGKVLLENVDMGSRLLYMGLGTQEDVIKASTLQGRVLGMMTFPDRLLGLAKTEEDEEDV